MAPAPRHGLTALFSYAVAAFAGLMFGLDIGAVSGATRYIQAELSVSDRMIEWIVSSMMLGAAAGALLTGALSRSFGRKRSLIAGGVLFVAGATVCATAPSPGALVAGRVLLGVAVGITSVTAPLYLAEIAPSERRGAIISLYQFLITAGILVAFLCDTALSYSGDWRWMLGLIGFPGAVFVLGALFLTESPRWLMLRGREAEAAAALARLGRTSLAAQGELAEIRESLRGRQSGVRLFKEDRNFRRSMGLGMALQVMQQLTGINVVMYYAPRIFQHMGYEDRAQMWFTAGAGLVNVLATLIAIFYVDRWGKKPMLSTGFFIMAASLGLVGAMMSRGIKSHAEQLFTVVMLLVFIAGFAMSAGPVIWALCSEVQPLRGRDIGVAASTFVNWGANTLIGATFLTLLNGFGPAATFWLYAALNLLFIIVTALLVPETKGVSLEEIEKNLSAGKPLREIGR